MPFQPKVHNIDGDVLKSHFHLPVRLDALGRRARGEHTAQGHLEANTSLGPFRSQMAQVAKKFDVCLTFL